MDKQPCPLCGGEGEKLVPVKTPTGFVKLASQMCLCRKSEFVSQQYKILDWVDDYLDIDQIDPALKYLPSELNKSPNYLIRGTSVEAFSINVKSVIMHYRFRDPPSNILCCRAIDILHRFYVQQNDGTSPHLSETDKFDLVIFSMDTHEKNDQLKTVIAQVVHARKNRRPTWIYLPKPTLEACKWEYSPELQEMLKSYEHIGLKSRKAKVRDGYITKSSNDAANFGG